MNFAEMLMRPFKVEYPAERISQARSGNPKPNHLLANDGRHTKAFESYSEVMGEDWIRTQDVTRKLGLSRGTTGEVLTRWFHLGLVERRPYGGKFNRKRGWEWRMK